MRRAALLIVLFAGAAVAEAQSPAPRLSPTLPPIGLPLPRISPPLAPIGVPRAIMQPPSVGVPSSHGRRGDDWRSDRDFRSSSDRRRHVGGGAVYIVPGYVWGYPYFVPPPDVAAPIRPPADRPPVERGVDDTRRTGTVRIDVALPQSAQVYVDGYFAGTLYDVRGELVLDPGPHRIEIRADGQQTVAFDVLISAGRTITYRPEPDPQIGSNPPAAPSPPVHSAPTTVYFIPGCYLGNVPPANAALPASCDQSRVTTFQP